MWIKCAKKNCVTTVEAYKFRIRIYEPNGSLSEYKD